MTITWLEMTRQATQRSLFDSLETWHSKPVEAFAAFVLSPEFVKLGRRKPEYKENSDQPQSVRSSSAEIYLLMFSKFVRWMEGNKKSLFSVSPQDLMGFLDHGQRSKEGIKKDLNSAIRVRYLRMLERVFQHLEVRPNPAQAAAFETFEFNETGKDLGKIALTDEQHAQFMAQLPEPKTEMKLDNPHYGWKRRRDRAMQAMMLGAGMKVSEVIGIYSMNVGKVEETGSIPITITPASTGGASRWHRTRLRPFAVPEVTAWLSERRKMKIPGSLLFPATLKGGVLNKATVYRQVKATFERAGLDLPRKGGRTLRNSFAFRELQNESIELVGEFLGHRKRKSTLQYVASPARTKGMGTSKENRDRNQVTFDIFL